MRGRDKATEADGKPTLGGPGGENKQKKGNMGKKHTKGDHDLRHWFNHGGGALRLRKKMEEARSKGGRAPRKKNGASQTESISLDLSSHK